MRELLSGKNLVDIGKSVDALRQVGSQVHSMYYVVENPTSSTGNPIEPIFGERVNPFDSVGFSNNEVYIPFVGSILGDESEDDYDNPGFERRRNLTIDVSADTEYRQNLLWRPGRLVMVDGVRFRVDSIDRRGLVPYNRLFISLEKVT